MLALQVAWLWIAWQVEEQVGRLPSLPVNLFFCTCRVRDIPAAT